MKIEESCVRQWQQEKEYANAQTSFTYDVITEEIPFSVNGEIAVTAFSYSYLKKTENNYERPVIFAYNGGPGSACVWLHLGLLGTMRVKMNASEINPSVLAPYGFEQNPYSLLDIADLVLIDPPGCGYGEVRLLQQAQDFFGVIEDAACVAQLIERWIIVHKRIQSPKYLLGESYGTIRNCMLLRALMGGPMAASRKLGAISINGVIMMGTAINIPPLQNDFKAEESILQLIGMTATRLYHFPLTEQQKQDWEAAGLFPWENKDIKTLADGVWNFAATKYLPALFWGSDLEAGEKRKMIRCLSLLTGIDEDWFLENGLLLSVDAFSKELLRGRHLDIGRYDTRYTMEKFFGNFYDPVADDPAMGQYTPVFLGVMNDQMKTFLGIEKEITWSYRGIDFSINGRWNYQTPEKPDECLAAAMRRNKDLRVLFMTGLYDLVTPPGNVRYLVSHGNLPKDRITVKEYSSGHMPYLGIDAIKQVTKDLKDFILNQ